MKRIVIKEDVVINKEVVLEKGDIIQVKESNSQNFQEAYALDAHVKKYFPQANSMISKVSEALEWNITGAMSFCVNLLDDVNAHTEAEYVRKYFLKELSKLGL